ncbi:hypothetical protein Salat_0237900 [Sesamum alatum]|uniref:Uncharacterized protein n=1 Tax=Sesamum alatum TaxID=300844 RepID=A0AAE1YZD3_9LAMI|nr:hypothetical protein Salat_0237900 [Sesamum alatum]
MEENESDEEKNIEVEEIIEWSDSVFEGINADDDEDNENNWSDYTSDKDQFPYESDHDLQVAVKAYIEPDFKDAMEEIKTTNLAAHKWLIETCGEEPSTWSRHGFDTSVKVDHVTNNMTEPFNAFLVKTR